MVCFKECKRKVSIDLRRKRKVIDNLGLWRSLEGTKRWCRGTLRDDMMKRDRISLRGRILLIEEWTYIATPKWNTKTVPFTSLKKACINSLQKEWRNSISTSTARRFRKLRKHLMKLRNNVRQIRNLLRVRNIRRVREVLENLIWNINIKNECFC